MTLLEETICALKRSHIASAVFQSGEEAMTYLDLEIEDHAVVGVGDSMTLENA